MKRWFIYAIKFIAANEHQQWHREKRSLAVNVWIANGTNASASFGANGNQHIGTTWHQWTMKLPPAPCTVFKTEMKNFINFESNIAIYKDIISKIYNRAVQIRADKPYLCTTHNLNGTNGQLFIGVNGGHWRQWPPMVPLAPSLAQITAIGDSISGEQWRWRQWDLLGTIGDSANGTIGANCTIGDIAIYEIWAIGANGSTCANGNIANGVIGAQMISLAPMSLCTTFTIANGAIWMAPMVGIGANDGIIGAHWRQWPPLVPMKSCLLVLLAPIILQSCSIVLLFK